MKRNVTFAVSSEDAKAIQAYLKSPDAQNKELDISRIFGQASRQCGRQLTAIKSRRFSGVADGKE